MNILKNIPETAKGVILIIAGLSLLLHTLGYLQPFLWYALVAISLYVMIVGFVKIGGVKACKALLKKEDKKEIIYKEQE